VFGCVEMSLLLLAFEAAIYPTLLAAVVILLAQPRPRRLLTAYLAGGMTVSVVAGLVIVFVLSGTELVTSQRSGLSWRADLAVGGLAILLAVALATRADQRFRERRRRRRTQAPGEPASANRRKEPWSERLLTQGSIPIVFGAALVLNVPGAAYLIALKDIAAGDHTTATQVALILAFNAIMFMLAEIPLVGLFLAPDRTSALVRRLNDWVSGNGRAIAMVLCLAFGGFLVARGIANAR
jgi:hypothetical protein